MERKQAYEWVLVFFNENIPDIVLTEKQHDFYQEHRGDKIVDFDDCSVAPSGIVTTFRRPAQVIKQKYPCLACNTNGYIAKSPTELETCPKCGGTGVNL